MYTSEYIIVGQGLAGTAIAQQLHQRNKTFKIIDILDPNQASRIASGIWNPVVLKRMKKVWLADEMLHALPNFYNQSEHLFGVNLGSDLKVHRLFSDTEEANNWIGYSDDNNFNELLYPEIQHSKNGFVNDKNGLGLVKASGRIDTEKWLSAARKWFKSHDLLLESHFDHLKLKVSDASITYGEITAKAIIFCEGMYASIQNPFFKWLPFALTKGEVLLIESKELDLNKIINSGVFILPLGNHLYKVGATYAWNTLDKIPTEKAKEELIFKLKKFISAPFKIIEQQAGIRPTIQDRRPLLGSHPIHKNIHIFNGMGSRGILMAPYLSQIFVDHLIDSTPLPQDADIKRFKKYFAN